MGSSYATRAMGDPAFNSPVKIGRISSTYGERPWPIGEEKGKIKFHKGVDIAGKSGSAIYAVNTGTVIEVEKDYKNASNPQLGNYIVIDHGNNMESRYFHLLDVNVEKGQRVGTDRPIGTMGNTGQATGAHLHFELYNQGSHVNPADYIDFALEKDPK
jgi:murein DD-endopeptidase MepM/ murein hydrolase activator NlpD